MCVCDTLMVCDAINVFCEGTVTFVGTTFTVVRNSIRNLITPSLKLCYVKVREKSEKKRVCDAINIYT